MAIQKGDESLGNKKRTKMDVVSDMLKVIQDKGGKMKPTHLMYKANLSYKIMKDYISMLENKNLILQKTIDGKKAVHITEKGRKFYLEYLKMREFEKTFGL